MIKYYNDKGDFLVSHDLEHSSIEEVKATVEMLEYENNCKVTYKVI